MEEKIVLRAEGLVKRYGKRTVVNDVTFDVKQGEIVGLLGPNGAGKTTSFYMTTGLVLPNGGHIYLGDHEVTSYPVYKRARAGIGYLAQEASVFRKMSVEDNILSVLEMTGKPREEQIEVLEGLIADFRLEKVRKNFDRNEQRLFATIMAEGVQLGRFEIDSIPLCSDIMHYCIKGLEIPYIYGRLADGMPQGMSRGIVQKLIHKALSRQDRHLSQYL